MSGYGFGDAGSDAQTLRVDLEAQQLELAALLPRVVETTSAVESVDASYWQGPANLACQLAMAGLRRDCAGAVELVRWARELNEAALYELQAHA
jgi:hypothetical protein